MFFYYKVGIVQAEYFAMNGIEEIDRSIVSVGSSTTIRERGGGNDYTDFFLLI